jgi:Dolichyl-phosphate-mannose-protein mannosyltransferase
MSAVLSGGRAGRGERRWPWWLGVLVLLAGVLALRVWGVRSGLPYAYNADENAHFVPKAIGLFGHGWNPHYFVNPPAFTYALHIVFAVWFGGRAGVSNSYAADPTSVLVVARVTAALLGTLAVWLLYLAGARMFDRRVGLLAAALLGVGFLPVFYAHLALNDVPTLAPICLSLWGTAGVLRDGRLRWYVLAGAGLGLATATKYTGGIVLLPLLAAAAVHLADRTRRRQALAGLVVAGVLALAAFFVANPYALLSPNEFREGLRHQSSAADDAMGKLGLTHESGIRYYLWTFTWGLGFVPLAAAVLGAFVAAVRDPRAAAVLIPAPLLFVLFMGAQGRFFGRWLLPVFPLVCLLAAAVVVLAANALGRRSLVARRVVLALGTVALLGQGVVAVVHNDHVLARPDTRNLTRAWLVRHVPVTTKIVVEPVMPDAWAQDVGHPSPQTSNGNRWVKFAGSRSLINPDTGKPVPPPGVIVNIEDYERVLRPALVDRYEQEGYCWVLVGSTQRGRAEAEPGVVPQALAYYRELERRADVAYEASPYGSGKAPVAFNFDWSFDYYPLAYERPGPLMTVYRLRGGRCAGVSSPGP